MSNNECDLQGPIDKRVLKEQAAHRSSSCMNNPRRARVKFDQHGTKWKDWQPSHPGITSRLKESGFYLVMQCAVNQLNYFHLTALVERWRPETNTFHMRHGEMTITLQDMAILTGLRVDGLPVIADIPDDYRRKVEDLLGNHVPDWTKSKPRIKIDWLQKTYSLLPEEPSDEALDQHTRAYILYFLANVMFADSSTISIPAHYTLLLRDFKACGMYAWGAAALAYLYSSLSNASRLGARTAYGWYSLVQIWSWFYLAPGRPKIVNTDYYDHQLPLMSMYARSGITHTENARSTQTSWYAIMFDELAEMQVTWQPYTPELLHDLPKECMRDNQVWRTRVPLICFSTIQMHHPDRVLKQFGLNQYIPCDPFQIHHRKVASRDSLTVLFAEYLDMWEHRRDHIVNEAPEIVNENFSRYDYMVWYWGITLRWISKKVASPIVEYQPRRPKRREASSILRSSIEEFDDALEVLHRGNMTRFGFMVTEIVKKMKREYRALPDAVDYENAAPINWQYPPREVPSSQAPMRRSAQSHNPTPQPTIRSRNYTPPSTIHSPNPTPQPTIQAANPTPQPVIQLPNPTKPTIESPNPTPQPTIPLPNPTHPPTIKSSHPTPPPTIQAPNPTPPTIQAANPSKPTIESPNPTQTTIESPNPTPQTTIESPNPTPQTTIESPNPTSPPTIQDANPTPQPIIQLLNATPQPVIQLPNATTQPTIELAQTE